MELFKTNKKYLQFTGYWFGENFLNRYSIGMWCFSVFGYVIPQITQVLTASSTNEFNAALSEHMFFGPYSFKIAMFFLTYKGYEALYRSMSESLVYAKERNIPEWNEHFRRRDNYCSKLTISYTMLWVVASTTYPVFPIVNAMVQRYVLHEYVPKLPYILRLEYGFRWDSSLPLYIVYMSVSVPWMAITVGNGALTDLFIVNSLIYIADFVKFIKFRLRGLAEIREQEENEAKREQQSLVLVKEVVEEHERALTMIKDLEKCITFLMWLYYTILTFTLCFILMQIVIIRGKIDEIVGNVFYFIAALMQLSLFSYYCDALIREIESLTDEIYNELPWYEFSPTIKKALQMIMVRCYKRTGITCGKFYFISLDMYGSVLKATVSYFFFLKNVYTK